MSDALDHLSRPKWRRPRRRRSRGLQKVPLTIPQILEWVDEFHARTGKWPNTKSGRVWQSSHETWRAIDQALLKGMRGLSGRSSLAQVIAGNRKVVNRTNLPRLEEQQVLAWADAFHERTGKWPNNYSGRVDESPQLTWRGLGQALRNGCRGLPGGTTLLRLIAENRNIVKSSKPPRQQKRRPVPLTIPLILEWIDAFHERTGKWPNAKSGLIPETADENWKRIEHALRKGLRGLSGGRTIAQVIAQYRNVINRTNLPQFSEQEVLAWADAFHERTGKWPKQTSGRIPEAPRENWRGVENALRLGMRGFIGGDSLPRFIARHRNVINRTNAPRLIEQDILAWADAFHERTGKWPAAHTGRVAESPHESWINLDHALRNGLRGLPGGTSLARLIASARNVINRTNARNLTEQDILAWADVFHERTGKWPTAKSGQIPEAPHETWSGIATALRDGLRGLPGCKSLARILARHRSVLKS